MTLMPILHMTQDNQSYPDALRAAPSPPQTLYYMGNLPELLKHPRLAVVGSRKVTPYGKQVTYQLSYEAARQGVVIISGLALGVDAISHQAALDADGGTIAILASGLDTISPRSNLHIARSILDKGGAIVSEYPVGTPAYKPSFVARNRIVAGLSDGVLITEAALKSGTIHTANFALDQGRAVMAVPGNITSLLSQGTNRLIQTGATPVTNCSDILLALDVPEARTASAPIAANDQEAAILATIANGISETGELQLISGLTPSLFNQTLTMLEITGKIRPLGAGHWGTVT